MKTPNQIVAALSLIVLLTAAAFVNGQDKIVAKRPSVPVQVDESMLRAGGHFLAWGPVETNPSGFVDCLGIGEIALRGFQNLRRTPNEVAGSYGRNYASIVCLGNTAYVMVVGSENKKTTEIRDALLARFGDSNRPLPKPSAAQAVNYLFFSTTATRVSRPQNCHDIAFNAIRSVLPGARRLADGAGGSSPDLSAGIACRQTGARMSALVIVGGADERKATEVRETLRRRMATTVLIDEGTELNPVDGR